MENRSNAFQELEELYKDVETRISQKGVNCQCCGECCNFLTNGMRLYIFHLERLYLQGKLGKNLTLEEGKCSGQQKKLCSIHEWRPLGCRTQFCSNTLQEIYEFFADKIKEIESRYGIEYDYSEAFD